MRARNNPGGDAHVQEAVHRPGRRGSGRPGLSAGLARAHRPRGLAGPARAGLPRAARTQPAPGEPADDRPARRDRPRAHRHRQGRQALHHGAQRQHPAHESRWLGAGGLHQHRRPGAGLRFRRGREPHRGRCRQGPAVGFAAGPGAGAGRPRRRRSDPLRRRRGGGQERQDLPQRRLHPLRAQGLGRHLRGQRARHPGAVRHRPRAGVRPRQPRRARGGQGPELRQRRGAE